jgi:peptidoglycan/LPS O-acetylase OafA/YrhL
MIEIYDDTNESTVPLDLKTSRWIILLIIAVCMVVVILGLFNGEKIFETSTIVGVSGYTMAGLISYGLYVLMYRVQRYPTLYAALSFLSLGLAAYATGFDKGTGLTFSISATGYIILYLILIKFFNIDDPIVGD